jgi:hypothetical protein
MQSLKRFGTPGFDIFAEQSLMNAVNRDSNGNLVDADSLMNPQYSAS